jgi:alcohol dehydrogenase (cytochrome c)
MAENARRWWWLGVTATAVMALTAWMGAQAPPAAPAGQDDPQVRAGATLFRERCAECHGADGKGVAGHDLTRLWAAGATDARVFQTIRSGVPNTIMPSSTAPEDQLWAIVAYLRSASVAPAVPTSAVPAAGPEPVTLVTRDGRRIRGVRKSEDAFSVQVMEAGGRLQGYLKSDLLEVIRETVAVEARGRAEAGVTYQDLLAGYRTATSWPTFSGDYSGQRHSPLLQITPENVHRLAARWTFQTGIVPRRGFEGTPLIVDGVMYLTGPFASAWALDARTGRPFWRYRRELPNDLTYGAISPVNRGFGILGDRLFMVTPDAHVVSLDAKTGAMLWDTTMADYKIGYAATAAPLVIDGKVIVGISGGDFPTRGFLDAYDPATGARLWRFYTVPAAGEPGSDTWPSSESMTRGGGATWVTGSYDPDLNLLYWGTGNPNPLYYGNDRRGSNLYTASLIAIDAATGKLRWHHQFTPHDIHDWDSNHVPVLAEVPIGGQPRRVVMVANRNGFFYVFDRATGRLLVGKPFSDTTWARELDANGHPVVLNDGSKGCLPDQWGSTNYMPPSYDAGRRLFFVTVRETCAEYRPVKEEIVPGRISNSGTVLRDAVRSYGVLRAIDPATVERKWEFRYPTPTMAGVMSTASGVVFAGDNEGNFMAFDARSGRNLWFHPTGAPIWGAAPMTFMLDGRQHVVIGSGTSITAFALPLEPR